MRLFGIVRVSADFLAKDEVLRSLFPPLPKVDDTLTLPHLETLRAVLALRFLSLTSGPDSVGGPTVGSPRSPSFGRIVQHHQSTTA